MVYMLFPYENHTYQGIFHCNPFPPSSLSFGHARVSLHRGFDVGRNKRDSQESQTLAASQFRCPHVASHCSHFHL